MEHKHEEKCEGDCRCGDEQRGGGSCGSCGDKQCGGGGCRCGGHGSWGYGMPVHHNILRWVLAVAILAIVFKIGVEVGEFKAEIYGFAGGKGMIKYYRSMMIPEELDDDQNYFFFRRGGMMRGSIMEGVGTTTDAGR